MEAAAGLTAGGVQEGARQLSGGSEGSCREGEGKYKVLMLNGRFVIWNPYFSGSPSKPNEEESFTSPGASTSAIANTNANATASPPFIISSDETSSPHSVKEISSNEEELSTSTESTTSTDSTTSLPQQDDIISAEATGQNDSSGASSSTNSTNEETADNSPSSEDEIPNPTTPLAPIRNLRSRVISLEPQQTKRRRL